MPFLLDGETKTENVPSQCITFYLSQLGYIISNMLIHIKVLTFPSWSIWLFCIHLGCIQMELFKPEMEPFPSIWSQNFVNESFVTGCNIIIYSEDSK
jgi:hypothetical protein